MSLFDAGRFPLIYYFMIIGDQIVLFVRCDMAKFVEETVARNNTLLGDRAFDALELLKPAWELNVRDGFMAYAIEPRPRRKHISSIEKLEREKIICTAIAILVAEITHKLNNTPFDEYDELIPSHGCQKMMIESHPWPESTSPNSFSICGYVHSSLGNWVKKGENTCDEVFTQRVDKVVRRLLPSITNPNEICRVTIGGETGFLAFFDRLRSGLSLGREYPDRFSPININGYVEHIIGLACVAGLMNAYKDNWAD